MTLEHLDKGSSPALMRVGHGVNRDLGEDLYSRARTWLAEDCRRIEQALAGREEVLRGSRVLVTGAAGFLGFNFLHFFSQLNARFGTKPVTVIAADNYLRGKPRWIVELTNADPHMIQRTIDITKPWPFADDNFDFIIHCASVASPTYYRQYPLETLDANVIGLRHMLDLGRHPQCKSVLFFSSSEIYGDPPATEIPTKESYRGNVACVGPRACYDESKRMGETLCYIYAQKYQVPVKIVRPFNNYGPGLRLTDGRVLPDFCREVLAGRDIIIHSDGTPTRTFCYVSDAVTGYLLALLSSCEGEAFNIGSDGPEISMRELADLVLRTAGSNGAVKHRASSDSQYLTDNPQRRCPDIAKARGLLGFSPLVTVEQGLQRMLTWYREFVELEQSAEI
jgi:nucleoside-diphosphate-sugar epimerase